MAESVIFSCDLCGTRSEEEISDSRTQRCGVEFVFRGGRFAVHGAAAQAPLPPVAAAPSLPGFLFPFPIPPQQQSQQQSESPPSDELRVHYALCDGCVRRIAGLFDLRVEQVAEVGAPGPWEPLDRGAFSPFAPQSGSSPFGAAARVSSRPLSEAEEMERRRAESSRGEMIAQFPNRPGAGMPLDPVVQFPDVPNNGAGAAADDAGAAAAAAGQGAEKNAEKEKSGPPASS
jgi:hypothetical protein